MFRELHLPRWFLISAVCVPFAILVGYLLAAPFTTFNFGVLGLLLGALVFPLLLRWHHALLIFTWNSYLIVFFLPGQPNLGITLAAGSLVLSVLHRAMRSQNNFIEVPSVAWSLILLAIVVAVTAQLTGGIGGRTLGTESWGAKRYVWVFGAILGYFALVAERIPQPKAVRYASLFMVSGITAAAGDLIYLGGPKFYALFAVFSADTIYTELQSQDTLLRLTGVAFGAQSASYFMLLRYGVRGVFDIKRPWRLAIFLGAFAISLLGGFRSLIILGGLLILAQFWFERLYKEHYLMLLLAVIVLLGCGLAAFSTKLPLAIQRSLSFLPVEVDPTARRDAQGTLDWRLQMWKIVVPDIPRYLLLGKGFAYSGTDYFLTQEAMRRGMFESYESTLINGNYHSGLLTLIIPFGIWGMICFTWFCWASLRALYSNYRFGSSLLTQVNTFLLAYFVARLVFYTVFYGQFDLDLPVFTGVVALSIAINGGVRQPNDVGSQPDLESESSVLREWPVMAR